LPRPSGRRRSRSRHIAHGFLAIAFISGLHSGLHAAPAAARAASPLAEAAADLQAGKADEATALLNGELQADPKSAEANNLLCRVEFTLKQFDQAAGHCEKAVSLSPNNSRYHLWLGRALGERASRVSFLSAFSLAKRTRAEFETAVSLDPKDVEALADLGQFYSEAPGAVGGGMDKAEGVAAKMEALDATRGHGFRGELAEKKKDLATAEQELKTALTGAAHPAFQWMALASFYRRHERWADMQAAVKSGAAAAAHDRRATIALYNGGSVLARANRDLPTAIKLFESYLASPDKTEEAPAFDVLTQLARLRHETGDQAGAERDRAAALALAHEYKPAIEAKI
jgi:tetratricopeptide (TPR) repeat protein